jgi:hypothetical protein
MEGLIAVPPGREGRRYRRPPPLWLPPLTLLPPELEEPPL